MTKHAPLSILEEFAGRPVTDLEEAYQKAVGEVQGLQAQLGDRNRTNGEGNRLSDHEYHAWRSRANVALRHMLERQRGLKEALKTARRRFNPDTMLATELKTPEALIHAALATLRKLSGEVEMEPEEQRVIDALDVYLRTHGRVGA